MICGVLLTDTTGGGFNWTSYHILISVIARTFSGGWSGIGRYKSRWSIYKLLYISSVHSLLVAYQCVAIIIIISLISTFWSIQDGVVTIVRTTNESSTEVKSYYTSIHTGTAVTMTLNMCTAIIVIDSDIIGRYESGFDRWYKVYLGRYIITYKLLAGSVFIPYLPLFRSFKNGDWVGAMA